MEDKDLCRVCEESVPSKNRRALFSGAGKAGALVDRFNHLVAGAVPLSIADDECLSRFACRACVYKLEQVDMLRRKADDIERSLSETLVRALQRQNRVLGLKRGRVSTNTTPGSTSRPAMKRWRARPDSQARRSLFGGVEVSIATVTINIVILFASWLLIMVPFSLLLRGMLGIIW